MKILFNFDHSKVHNKKISMIFEGIISKQKKIFHATPHIKSLYGIWIENQYENFKLFQLVNELIIFNFKSPLLKVGILLS